MIENTSQKFKKLWLEVYNSIVRLKFYMYLVSFKNELILQLNREFTHFVQTHIDPKEGGLRFFGGNTLMAFSYLVLVRMFETLKEEFGPNKIEQILDNANWNYIGGDKFADLKNKYNMAVRTLVEKNAKGQNYYTNEKEKLFFFLRKLRNSVSHYNYEHPDLYSIRLWDENHAGIVEMEIVLEYADFLNLVADLGCEVNDALIKA